THDIRLAAFDCLVPRLDILWASSIAIQLISLYLTSLLISFGNASKWIRNRRGLGNCLNASQSSVTFSHGRYSLSLSLHVESRLLRRHSRTPQKSLPRPVFRSIADP